MVNILINNIFLICSNIFSLLDKFNCKSVRALMNDKIIFSIIAKLQINY